MKTPAIALIGYGKMGREIELAAGEQGFNIKTIVDIHYSGHSVPINASTLAGVDVCIEFTTPEAVIDNIRSCARCKKDLVVGTTGWFDRLDEARAIVAEMGIGLIYAANFSLGVHLFRKIVAYAGTLFNAHAQYDVAVHEQHHRMKKDAPSGTAYTLAQTLLGTIERKKRLAVDRPAQEIAPEELHVSSTRIGAVPGMHQVLFDSAADTIELTHTARSRRGLADGSLVAASWIHGRKGLFTIEDMLHDFENL
jgi:4-hydroxy-tetrahydrodipicolinate reductase